MYIFVSVLKINLFFMKKILACASLFFAVATASAQGTLEKNKAQINAGVGISNWGIPVVVGVDYGIAKDFTIGAEASYRSKKDSWYGGEWKHTGFSISANGNYHFNRILKLPSAFDLYAGLSVGYYHWTHKYSDDSIEYSGSAFSPFGIGVQIGGRYFFTKNFGINLEAGGGNVAGSKIGITYKF